MLGRLACSTDIGTDDGGVTSHYSIPLYNGGMKTEMVSPGELTSKEGADCYASSSADLQILLQSMRDPSASAIFGKDKEKQRQSGVELATLLKKQSKAIADGDLSSIIETLNVQALVLNKMFMRLAGSTYDSFQGERHAFELAYKAQNQCRRTLQAMADIASPKSATFVGSQYNAHNQQINNHEPSEAENERPVGRPDPIKEVPRKKA